MAEVFGAEYSRGQIEKHIGHLSQIAGVRMMELREGTEAGVRIADVRNGSGLRFQVSLDRGMDISAAEFKGIPLAWRSPAGDVHPQYYDPRGTGWARSFPGGLLTGCGLAQAGAPCVDEGEELGMHGRLSHIPAYEVQTRTDWRGDRCLFRVEGSVREYAVFRESLLLRRTVETELGRPMIDVRDRVVNEAPRSSPLMMLYHINVGWPLLDDGAKLLLNLRSTEPRDERAGKGLKDARTVVEPKPGFEEQVFYHDLWAGEDGFATAMMNNPKLNLALTLRFRQKELPRFIEWKMMGEGTYVLGLEPANCLTKGRAVERQKRTLRFLEPGEQQEFVVQIGIIEGEKARVAFIKDHNLQ